MVIGYTSPYNVPGEAYAGHVGDFTPPTYSQNFSAGMEIAKKYNPTDMLSGYFSQFQDADKVTAEEANNALSPYGIKPYNKEISRGELNWKLHQARVDQENQHVMDMYNQSRNPSYGQQLITGIGSSVAAFAQDPINIAVSLIGLPEATVGKTLASLGVAARDVEVGSEVALQGGRLVRTGALTKTLPIAEAVEVGGREVLPRAYQYAVGAVEGASANVLIDALFTKPMADRLHVDYSWNDVATGAVLGGVLGSGALWGIPADALEAMGKGIRAESPARFVTKLVEMTDDEIKTKVRDGSFKGASEEQIFKMRDDLKDADAVSRVNRDVTPISAFHDNQSLGDLVARLPYSEDTKISMVTKAVQDLSLNKTIDLDALKKLDQASKISTVFNKNINKGSIKVSQTDTGRFRAYVEGEEGALKDVVIERTNAQDAIDDLWSLYKVNFTQSERVKAGLMKEIDSRMEAMDQAKQYLDEGNKELAVETLVDYLTRGKAKQLDREIGSLERMQGELVGGKVDESAFDNVDFNLKQNELNSKRADFDSYYNGAKSEAEHIVNNFQDEYSSLEQYADAAALADRLREGGGIPVEEMQRIVEEMKHPNGTQLTELSMPDNSYAAQVKRNNENIVTLEETGAKLDKSIAKYDINSFKIDYDMNTGRTFTEQINRVNKIIDNIPNIISSIHDVVNNMVIGVYDVVRVAGESKPLSERIGDELKTTLADYNLHQGEVDFLANKITTMLDSTTLVDMAAKKVDEVKGYRETLIKRIDSSLEKIKEGKIIPNAETKHEKEFKTNFSTNLESVVQYLKETYGIVADKETIKYLKEFQEISHLVNLEERKTPENHPAWKVYDKGPNAFSKAAGYTASEINNWNKKQYISKQLQEIIENRLSGKEDINSILFEVEQTLLGNKSSEDYSTLKNNIQNELGLDKVAELEDLKRQLEATGEYKGVALEQYFPLIADTLFEFEHKIVHEKRVLMLQHNKIKERMLQSISFVEAATKNLKGMNQTADRAHLTMERLRSYIGGSLTSFTGSGVSVEALQRVRSIKFKRLIQDIEKMGLDDVFRRPEYKEPIVDNLLKLKYGEQVNNADDAARIALELHKHFGEFVNDFNSVGGNITKLGSFLVPDIAKMKDYASLMKPELNGEFNRMSAADYANYSREMFIDDWLNELDHEAMFHDNGIFGEEAKRKELGTIFNNFVYGKTMHTSLFSKKSPSLLDSADVLKFKDRQSELKFTLACCEDSLESSIKTSVDRLYNSYGLMSMFGPNPHAGIESVFDGLKGHFIAHNEGHIADYMYNKRNGLLNEVANVDGTVSTPGRGIGTIVGSIFRLAQTFNLGNTGIKSLTDTLQQTAALSLTGRKAGLSGYLDNMKFNIEGLTGNGRLLADSIGAGRDAFNMTVTNAFNMGDVYKSLNDLPWNKHTVDTHMRNVVKNVQDVYFSKVIFLKQLTEATARGTSLSWSNHMANMLSTPYEKLGVENTKYLHEYKITPFEWSIVKDYAVKNEKDILAKSGADVTNFKSDRKFFVIDDIKDIPYEELYNRYNEKFKENNNGKSLTKDRLSSFLNEIQDKFDMMAADVVYSSLTIPGARTMRWINFGTQPGTTLGEIARTSMQFKSFPMAQFRQNYGKLLGRHSEFGEANIWNNLLKGDALRDVGGYAASIIAMNFVLQWGIDILNGKSPTDFTQKGNWIGPVADCGAFSPAGMILFNSFKGDDSGRNWYVNLLKNLAGPANTRTAQTFTNVVTKPIYKTGTAADKWEEAGIQLGHESINNVPWHNALFFGVAWNALIGNHLNELLEPGYLYEQNKRLEERTGQDSGLGGMDIWDPQNY